MARFVDEFADCFKTKSPIGKELACRYVSGLLSQTQRKNMERMDERLGDAPALCDDTYEATQQFISSSSWSSAALFAQISACANERLGGTNDSVLCIDESSNAKKGTKSVGVSRQWNGRLGKEDNCQTGVYSALSCGNNVCLVGARLYLPKEWSSDADRCRSAGVPQERIDLGYQTKIDHARELIEEAQSNGIRFACVAMDAFYGRDSTLRRYMEQNELTYCVDVPVSARVFESRPAGQKRPAKIGQSTVSVGELGARLMRNRQQAAERITLRQGDNGQVEAVVRAVRVWEWSEGQEHPVELWLVVRQMADGTVKHSLCNGGKAVGLKRLARWQAARFWVERCFQDAKSHCGMAQYQARGWQAWHHHMALVALAVLFVMQERISGQTGITNLTHADVVELMEWALIKRPTEAQLVERIINRHRKRDAAAASKRRVQRKRSSGYMDNLTK
jgi:SRSO17 transposase